MTFNLLPNILVTNFWSQQSFADDEADILGDITTQLPDAFQNGMFQDCLRSL